VDLPFCFITGDEPFLNSITLANFKRVFGQESKFLTAAEYWA